jgi:lipoprotein-releasing system permease protein
MRATQETEGLVLKGIARDFSQKAFKTNVITGSLPIDFQADSSTIPVMVSRKIAGKLLLKAGDEVTLYFLQDPPRFRKGVISGLYQTGLEEYDEHVCLARAADLQELDGWSKDRFSAFEIYYKNTETLDADFSEMMGLLDFDLEADKITNIQMQIFDWLSIIGRNVQIILILICIVACFNSAGTMLIFTLEKIRVIGILKSLGLPNGSLSRLFWLLGIRIALKGILIGNAVGLAICFLQKQLHVVPLDAENYYVSSVPIVWNLNGLIWVNVALLCSLGVSLIIPAVFASRTSPVEAMRVR